MSRQKPKRNKPYRPKPSLPGGGLNALLRIEDRAIDRMTMADTHVTDLCVLARSALLNLQQGTASEESWAFVATAVNTGMLLDEMVFGASYAGAFGSAADALRRAQARATAGHAHRLDGDGLTAISAALDVHEEQLKAATRAEMRAALTEARRRAEESFKNNS